MRLWACVIFLLVWVGSCTPAASQQKWPNSLLWKISGNGLKQPSYLFGTMHLRDKRLFNFGDSLYHFIEKAEGFALEVDFTEYIDSVFARILREEEKTPDEKIVEIDTKKLGKTADSLLREFGVKGKKLTRSQLKKIRDERIAKLTGEGEMPTIVDGYLYGLALRKGKWLGAVEDVQDQLDLYDELGSELDIEDVFVPEEKLRYSLEQLMKLYIAEDLSAIEAYSYHVASDEWENKWLVQRNIKMARRMDSLAAIRSMFFAVGAAHLPGDSGLISLLRQKGFQVEPVFSSRRLPAEMYGKDLAALPWVRVVDENNLYSIEMPGQPSGHQALGEYYKMKIYFDLTTMTFYLSGSAVSGKQSKEELDRMMDEILESMMEDGGKLISRKKLVHQELPGVEVVLQNHDGNYRVRALQKDAVVYLLMAGTESKALLNSADVDRFFNSFKALPALKKDWVNFVIPEKGCSMKLPGLPKRKHDQEDAGEENNWKASAYEYVDVAGSAYFMIRINELREGYYLDGDSMYFEMIRQSIRDKIETPELDETGVYQGWPAHRLYGYSKKDGLFYRILTVTRGNRVYNLLYAGFEKANNSLGVDFLNSLSLTDYPEVTWSRQRAPDGSFESWAPAPFKLMPPDEETEGNNSTHFLAYDSVNVVSYQVLREPLSPYYWSSHDSLFFEEKLDGYISYDDTVLQKRFTMNGRLKGIEALVRSPQQNIQKKLRLLVNRDTLYSLVCFLPSQQAGDKNVQQFFDDFRLSHEMPASIFQSKAATLLSALKTRDSAEFERISAVLEEVQFSEADLPLLHEALLEIYPDHSDFNYSTHDLLLKHVLDLGSPATVSFIKENYSRLPEEKETLKYPLLSVLARLNTEASYRLLKELLVHALPVSGNARMLLYPLRDSLLLTKTLYPEILPLGRDSAFLEVIVGVSHTLIDSSLLSVGELNAFRKDLLAGAARHLASLKNDPGQAAIPEDWMVLLGRFNEPETNELLRQFLKHGQPELKLPAIIALLKNKERVDPKEIEKLATEKMMRFLLWEELKALKMEKLFPAKWATQKSFAEAEIYELASEEAEPEEIVLIGERTVPFMGKKQKFYLFKLVFPTDEGPVSHLGVTGPYDPSNKTLVTYTGAAGIYWQEAYDKKAIDKQFKTWLEEMEAFLKEE